MRMAPIGTTNPRRLGMVSLGLSLLLSAFPALARADIRDEKAISQLRAAGAQVTVGKDGRITGIVLWSDKSRVTDSDFACIEGLTGLRAILIFDNNLTDAGLAPLKSLPSLETVWIGGTHTDVKGVTHGEGTRLTNVTLTHLGGIKTLKRLTLAAPRFTDAGLVHLKGLPGLKSLGLSSKGFTDAGLAAITGLTSLEELKLSGSHIAGQGLSVLAGLPSLRTLTLGPNSFEARNVKPLADLAHLKTVLFYKSKLLPDALTSVETLTRLESLQFVETPLPSARLDRLKKAMPQTSFVYEEQERVMSVLSK